MCQLAEMVDHLRVVRPALYTERPLGDCVRKRVVVWGGALPPRLEQKFDFIRQCEALEADCREDNTVVRVARMAYAPFIIFT